jgi:hypothetical protein
MAEEGEERCGGHPICTIGCPRGVNGMWIWCIRNCAKNKGRPVKGVLPIRLGGDEISSSRVDAEVGKSRRLRSGCLGGIR